MAGGAEASEQEGRKQRTGARTAGTWEENVRSLPDDWDDRGVLHLARHRQADLRDETEQADRHHVGDVDGVRRELEVAEDGGRDQGLDRSCEAKGEQDWGEVNLWKKKVRSLKSL